MTKITQIYGLRDPRTGALRYVGKSNNVHVRVASHIYSAKSNSIHSYNKDKCEWIRDLLDINMQPDYFLIEEVPSKESREEEKFWISYFNSIGCDLLNIKGLRKVKIDSPGRPRRLTTEEIESALIERQDKAISNIVNGLKLLTISQIWSVGHIVQQFASDNHESGKTFRD